MKRHIVSNDIKIKAIELIIFRRNHPEGRKIAIEALSFTSVYFFNLKFMIATFHTYKKCVIYYLINFSREKTSVNHTSNLYTKIIFRI